MASEGLVDLYEIAKRADFIQESPKVRQLAAVSTSKKTSTSYTSIKFEGNLMGVVPIEEKSKWFSLIHVHTLCYIIFLIHLN